MSQPLAVHFEFDKPRDGELTLSMRWHRFIGGYISWRDGDWQCSCGKRWPGA